MAYGAILHVWASSPMLCHTQKVTLRTSKVRLLMAEALREGQFQEAKCYSMLRP